MLSCEFETRDKGVPSIRMQISSLSIILFPQTNGHTASDELSFRMYGEL